MDSRGKMVDGVWTIDRSTWAAGPWDRESDREQWTTKTGLPGLIVRNNLGGLCGYVAVPPGHPAHGKGYDDVDVSVHGGLTFSRACMADGPICHKPAPGEPDDVWWLGFDCVHAGDKYPALTKRGIIPSLDKIEDRFAEVRGRDVYRDMAYVRAETESLAEQLAAMDRSSHATEKK